jgi:hypothetical protein
MDQRPGETFGCVDHQGSVWPWPVFADSGHNEQQGSKKKAPE